MEKKILDDTGLARVADYVNGKETKHFTGTQAQWDALTDEQKKSYTIANITDDANGDIAAYMNNQLELSDFEDVEIGLTSATATTMPYDGEIIISNRFASNSGMLTCYVNDVAVAYINKYGGGYGSPEYESITVSFKKGDAIWVNIQNGYYSGGSGRLRKVRYYKKRDYSKREA